MKWSAKQEEKRRLKKLYDETGKFSCAPGAFRNDKRGGILERGYPYSTNHKNIKKWLRRRSNRKNRRRADEETLQRNQHKKQFDLWWELF